MRDNGLKALQKHRYKKTTDSHLGGPDRKWGADISCVWRAGGWLYLAIVLDLSLKPSDGAKLLKLKRACSGLRRKSATLQ